MRPSCHHDGNFYAGKKHISIELGPWSLKNPHTLKPKKIVDKNGQKPVEIFNFTFVHEKCWILIQITLKLVPKGPINNNIIDNSLMPNRW